MKLQGKKKGKRVREEKSKGTKFRNRSSFFFSLWRRSAKSEMSKLKRRAESRGKRIRN
jgi:hypothetical protein